MSQQIHHIPSLLRFEELTEIDRWIIEAGFIDGKATASIGAREVKNNLQIDAANAVQLPLIQEMINNALQSSPLFQAAA